MNRLIYDKQFVTSEKLFSLISHPDSFLAQPDTTILKNGKSCTLGWTSIDNHRYVIKRYKFRSKLTFLKRCLRMSRACRSWRNARQLQRAGIMTPQPIAYRERRFGPIVGGAYFFYQHVEGDTAIDFFQKNPLNDTLLETADAIVDIFKKLFQARIVHSDLKAQNFIISNVKVYLIDLDTMYTCHFSCTFKRAFNKDMRRFLSNWKDMPHIYNLFQGKLIEANLLAPTNEYH